MGLFRSLTNPKRLTCSQTHTFTIFNNCNNLIPSSSPPLSSLLPTPCLVFLVIRSANTGAVFGNTQSNFTANGFLEFPPKMLMCPQTIYCGGKQGKAICSRVWQEAIFLLSPCQIKICAVATTLDHDPTSIFDQPM